MKTLRTSSSLVAVALLALAFISPAGAQTRNWVASSGNDMNACSRTQPCLTFAGALSKTPAGGEINCVDANDYGQLNITKAITIDCAGTLGSIIVPQGNNIGIFINAGASDVVTLRNLSVNGGASNNGRGIWYSAGGTVHLDNVRIASFSTCLDVSTGAATMLTVDNSTISDCGVFGIELATLNGTAAANITNTQILNTSIAVDAGNGARVTLRNCTIFFSSFGIRSSGAAQSSIATIVNSTVGYCGSALVSFTGQYMFAFGNTFVNNQIIYRATGGMIFTGSDNNNVGNGSVGTATGGNVPKV